MNDQELRTHQLKAVEAMKEVDRFCREENIRYFMIAGSTLGAVRHKGFIPWDDDIDIAMTMDQYARFVEKAPGAIRPPYQWKHTTVDDSFPTLTGKILYGDDEPLITVFPLVKLSDDPLKRKIQWAKRKIFSPIWQRKVGYRLPKEQMNLKQRVSVMGSALLSLFLPKKTVLNILRKNETRYEDQDVVWCCNLYSKYSLEKESIRLSWTRELIRAPFEDTEFPIVKEYDAYLTHLYGDYMTPPSEKERHPVHLEKGK